MLRKDVLIHKPRMLLDEFLTPMLGQVDKSRQRFLRQTLRAIPLSGSLVVMELCKWIRYKWFDLSRETTAESYIAYSSRRSKPRSAIQLSLSSRSLDEHLGSAK